MRRCSQRGHRHRVVVNRWLRCKRGRRGGRTSLHLSIGSACGLGRRRRCLCRAPGPMRSERLGTRALGQEIRVVREDARSEVLRRVGRLGSEGGVALVLPCDIEPPPRRARRGRRRCAAAGERAAVVLELQDPCSLRKRFDASATPTNKKGPDSAGPLDSFDCIGFCGDQNQTSCGDTTPRLYPR